MLKRKSPTERVWVPALLLRGELSGDQECVLDLNEFLLLTRHVSDGTRWCHTMLPLPSGLLLQVGINRVYVVMG